MTARAGARAVLIHPGMELVGLYSYSADKVGRDIGELVGADPIGIKSVGTVEEVIAAGPDCVFYAPFRPDIDHVVQLLEAGINLVAPLNELAGSSYGEDVQRRIASACEKGGSTLYTSGVYPGNVNNVALAATALVRRVDRLTILESVDFCGYPNETMYRAMGIDLEMDDPRAMSVLEENCGSFKESVRFMAHALDLELDEVRFEGTLAAANRDTDFGFMTVRKGRIAGFKGAIKGIVDGVSRIECQFTWALGTDMTPSFPLEHGYIVQIEGDPEVKLHLVADYKDNPTGDSGAATATAMGCINAIKHVVSAEPGVLNFMKQPFVTAAGRVGLPA
jgi:hypothetical protein